MSKRTIFTTITPLPLQVSRQIVIDMLHDHDAMIELNPLVIDHRPMAPPANASPEEFAKCVWQQLTDRVSYLPGGMVTGKVQYNASFYDLPYGLQTHVYAPLGLDIRGKWSVGGNIAGEPRVKEELGVSLPRDQLYLREDVDMRCNILMTGFVKKTLQKAHSVLVSRLLARSEYVEDVIHEQRFSTATTSYRGPSTYSSSGSHTSVSPHVAQEEYRNSTSLSYRPSTEVSVVHELGETSSPAELYSDPGFNEPESSHLGSSNVELNNPSTNNSGFIHAGLHNAGPNSPGFDCPKHNDPGLNDTEFNNPALNKYQSQRKANPYS